MKHAQREAKRFQQKKCPKVPNIAILVHIMAIFTVFQDIKTENPKILEYEAPKSNPKSPFAH